jgi:hypothetical protein
MSPEQIMKWSHGLFDKNGNGNPDGPHWYLVKFDRHCWLDVRWPPNSGTTEVCE